VKKIFFSLTLFLIANNLFSQYPPPAGQAGSTAIAYDSSIIIDWANSCNMQRGHMDISNTSLGLATYGADTSALGIADNNVISLGDAGTALLTFSHPIVNGNGFDFAVFENGMMDTYLELAFVEVSSDGIHYVRFSSVSLTSNTLQVAGFGLLDCVKIHNLAGKYRVFFGTPFDLDDVKDSANIDVNNITHVRIVDVVGCIQSAYATYDSQGNIVNDPWNTPFASGGFDLDAVGVIHNTEFPGGVNDVTQKEIKIFPNPCTDGNLQLQCQQTMESVHIYNQTGMEIFSQKICGKSAELTLTFNSGIYVLKVTTRGNPDVFCKLIVANR
jgi:hypothetical protein